MSKHSLSCSEFATKSGSEPKQLVVFLHGYGSNGDDLISLASEYAPALPDAHFISPNAPFRCELAPAQSDFPSYQWFSLTSYDPDYLYEGVQKVIPILDSFINSQLNRFSLTHKNLLLIGFSQGTMLSLHYGLHKKDSCAGILGYSGMLLDAKPIKDTLQAKPPICLIHGTADNVVPFASMQTAKGKLAPCGITIETHKRPHLGHGIDYEGVKIGNNFLKKCIA